MESEKFQSVIYKKLEKISKLYTLVKYHNINSACLTILLKYSMSDINLN